MKDEKAKSVEIRSSRDDGTDEHNHMLLQENRKDTITIPAENIASLF